MLDNTLEIPPYYECDSINTCLQDKGIKESDIIVFNSKKYRLHFNSKNHLLLNSKTKKIVISITTNTNNIVKSQNGINNILIKIIQKVRNIMNQNLILSKQLLKEIREESNKGNVEHKIFLLMSKIEKSGKKLSNIGTNEKELKELNIKGVKIAAKNYLEDIKIKYMTGNIDYLIRHFQNCLNITGETLEYYGISQRELDYMDKKGHEITAKNALNSLKTANEENNKYYLKVFLVNRQESGKTFESYGIDSQEISKFLNR